MVDDINSLEKSFTEMQQYNDAQFRVITTLQEKLKKLEDENKHLKSLLESNTQHLEFMVPSLGGGISNEQLICETQIALLKDEAVKRALTMEEARKLQTYVEVLEKIKKKKEDSDINVRKLSDDELIQLVVNNESNK